MRLLPDAPTIAEAGSARCEAVNWTGLIAPVATPAAIVSRLNEEIRKVLRQDEVIARLATEGSEPMGSTPEEFRALLWAERKTWGRVVCEARVQLA